MNGLSPGAQGGAPPRLRPCQLLWLLGLTACLANAQVPSLLQHQGRVLVGGLHFTGTGHFKFALIQGTNDVTLWSNDATSAGGSEPAAAVPLPVEQGLYSVLLGDVSLPHMTVVPAQVFTNSDVRLRIWFDDGAHGSQRLEPDQRLAASGYALVAASGGGGTGGGSLSPGSVGPVELAPGAAQANLVSGGLTAVPHGGIVLGTAVQSAAMEAAGYTRIGRAELTDAWESHNPGPNTAPRYFGGCVWTGSNVLYYGGYGSSGPAVQGAQYTPSTRTWSVLSTNDAPPELRADGFSTLWTGREMIVWGGENGVITNREAWNTGGRYNPATDSWTTMALPENLGPRSSHAAVWTGSEMLIWGGGIQSQTNYADGARYNPDTDLWTPMSTHGAPSPRSSMVAVWTGTEMIVWGGADRTGKRFADGARYNPVTDSWTAMTNTLSTPTARESAAAAWTGSRLVIWSGYNGSPLSTGAVYDPVADAWSPMNTVGAPTARFRASAFWTGTEVLFWGGAGASTSAVGAAGRYSPADDIWSDYTTRGIPGVNRYPLVQWTGNELLIQGGNPSTGVTTNSVRAYIPPRHLYLYQHP